MREGKGAGRAWASAGNVTQWCIQARLWGQTRQRGARLRRPAALILPVRPTFLDPALHPPCLRPVLPTPPCRFFDDYKKNENKLVVVDEFLGRKDALRIIREAMVRGPACWVSLVLLLPLLPLLQEQLSRSLAARCCHALSLGRMALQLGVCKDEVPPASTECKRQERGAAH